MQNSGAKSASRRRGRLSPAKRALTALIAKDKAVEGVLKTAFSITAEGYVSKARIDKKASTLKDGKLHDCVVAVLSTMQFPAPPDGKERPIEFPFNLKAVN